MSNILLVSATKLEHHDESINGIPIHIIGIGKVNAALNLNKLIQQHKLTNGGGKPTRVINFGSCGNLKDYNVGELLPIGEVIDDFYGGVVDNHKAIKISDSPYKLFTTDIFYDATAVYSNDYTEKVRKSDVVDMEGYSIAKVCESYRIPLEIVKWVSDDGSKASWEANAAIGYNNFKQYFNNKYN